MSLTDFQQNSLWLNVVLFALAACAIWFAGIRLERQADAIASRTGLGYAFIGMLLLAGATSLPEIATTMTAVWINNIPMALHNLLGSVVFNTAALAIADLVAGKWALTHRSPHYVLMMEGVGVIALLALVLLGGAFASGGQQGLPEVPWEWVAVGWGIVLILGYFGLLYVTHYSQGAPRWKPVPIENPRAGTSQQHGRAASDRLIGEENGKRGYADLSSPLLYAAFALASLVVLIAGSVLTRAGDAMAAQTGLGGSFVGFAFIALATTLPEISTTIAAARSGNYSMTISNIFGSSAFVIMLIGLVAIFAGGDALMQSASPSATFAAALGILVTLIYLGGLLERQDRTVLRMGWDSAAVLCIVLAGSWMMFMLR